MELEHKINNPEWKNKPSTRMVVESAIDKSKSDFPWENSSSEYSPKTGQKYLIH